MEKVIKITPLTRIEGHAELKMYINGNGTIKKTEFKVYGPTRAFEIFLCGNPGEDVPRLATRICGLCYSAHMLSAVKAIEDAWAVEPPEDAVKMREIMALANTLQSHALHYVMMVAPDFLCSPHEKGGLFALIKQDKKLVEAGMNLRQIGQKITEILGGRAIHPVTAVPGGMTKVLDKKEIADMERMLKGCRKSMEIVKDRTRIVLEKSEQILNEFEDVKSNFIYLQQQEEISLYDAGVHLMDIKGEVKTIKPDEYSERLRKPTVDYSFVPQPYFKGMDLTEPVRTGPLARINQAEWNTEMLKDFDRVFNRPSQSSFAFNIARVIEMEESIKRMEKILDEGIGSYTRDSVKPKKGKGIGIVEAPRGLLCHCYTTDHDGIVTGASILTPTAQNQLPIEKSAEAAARVYLEGKSSNEITQEDLNKVEMVIRAYDPCISCALRIIHVKDEKEGKGNES